jgi:hypothetical protein
VYEDCWAAPKNWWKMKVFGHRRINVTTRREQYTKHGGMLLTPSSDLVTTWPEILGYARRDQHRTASEKP